jgi:hypothetical protein
MHLPTVIGALALTAHTAFAARAVVNNKCHYPVWVSSVQDTKTELEKIQPGASWSEELKPVKNYQGVSIQIIPQDHFTGSPILNMQYSLGEDLWYSMSSSAELLAFKDEKLRIHNTDSLPLTEIVWVGDHRPEGTEVYMYGEASLTLELCDDFARRFRA